MPKISKLVDRRKKVIDALRNKPMRHNELVKKVGIPEKTVDRILHELKFMRLAIKRKDGYWSWYEYSQIDLTLEEQEKLLEHAEKLKPSFDAILNREQEEDRKFAEKHLQTGYPVIYEKLVKFERLEAKLMKLRKSRAGKVLKKLEEKYVPEENLSIGFRFGKRPRKGWLRKIIPKETVLAKVDRPPYAFGPFDTLEEIKEIFTTFKVNARVSSGSSGKHYILGPIQLYELEKSIGIQNQMYEAFQELAGAICLLMLRVEHGTPLEGKCLLCPPLKHK